jgi:hypothetical protein
MQAQDVAVLQRSVPSSLLAHGDKGERAPRREGERPRPSGGFAGRDLSRFRFGLYLANDNLRALKEWKIFELLAVALTGLCGSDRLQKLRSPFLVTT